MLGINSFLFIFFTWLSYLIISVPLPFKERISASLGTPVHASIRYIWLIVEVPGNMGLVLNTSPIKHPIPQMSIALV